MISILDYGAGNIKSVYNAFKYIDVDVNIVTSYKEAKNTEAIIFPGVGSFDSAIISLRKSGLDKTILEAYENEKPFLGICLGLQMLFEKSEEGKEKGLGIFEGEVRKISKQKGLLIPHMGFDDVLFKNKNEFQDKQFYFVHSYFVDSKNKDIVVATCEYGTTMDVMINSKSFTGVQFHPEKSSEEGLRFLQNWIRKEVS